MKKLILIFSLLLPVTAFGDTEASRTIRITQSFWHGPYYFVMTPKRGLRIGYDYKADKVPVGRAFKITKGGSSKQIWEVRGWYAHKVFLSYDGQYLVRMGNWPRGSEPTRDHLAVAFYKNGKKLAAYSVLDLIKNKKSVQRSVSHYAWQARERGYPYMSSTIEFRIKTIENTIYVFNIETGKIIEKANSN